MESVSQTTRTLPDYKTQREAELELKISQLYSLLDCLLQECTAPGGCTQAPTRSLYREARAALPDGYQMTVRRRLPPKRKDPTACLGHDDKCTELRVPERCAAWKKDECQHPLCPQKANAEPVAACPLPR